MRFITLRLQALTPGVVNLESTRGQPATPYLAALRSGPTATRHGRHGCGPSGHLRRRDERGVDGLEPVTDPTQQPHVYHVHGQLAPQGTEGDGHVGDEAPGR
jgi:hypothetical protein